MCVQSVLNTMCGYGVQRLDESSANQLVSTSGCLQELLTWSSNNLLLLGGLLGALLLLEVNTHTLTHWLCLSSGFASFETASEGQLCHSTARRLVTID